MSAAGTHHATHQSGLAWRELHKSMTAIKRDYLGTGNDSFGPLLSHAVYELFRIKGMSKTDAGRFLLQTDNGVSFGGKFRVAVLQMKSALEENEYSLMMGTSENMTCYVMEYDVRVDKSIDVLKLAYWYGHGVIELFVGIKRDIAKIALLLYMDNMVKNYTKGQGIDPQIFSKLAHTLLQERTRDNLGRYGVYMIFKNAALMCVDTCACGKERVEQSSTTPP